MKSDYKDTVQEVIRRSRGIKNKEGQEVFAYQIVERPDFPVLLFKDDLISEKNDKLIRLSVKSYADIQRLIESHFGASTEVGFEKIRKKIKRMFKAFRHKFIRDLEKIENQLIEKIPKDSTVLEFLRKVDQKKLEKEEDFVAEFEKLLRYFGSDLEHFSPDQFLENIQSNIKKLDAIVEKEIPLVAKFVAFGKDSKILKTHHRETLQGWIQEIHPESRPKMIYQGSVDGTTPGDFHRTCDNKGPTLVVIKNELGKLFGGYNHGPWKSDDSKLKHPECFMFSLDLNMKFSFGGGRSTSGTLYSTTNSPSHGFFFGSSSE